MNKSLNQGISYPQRITQLLRKKILICIFCKRTNAFFFLDSFGTIAFNLFFFFKETVKKMAFWICIKLRPSLKKSVCSCRLTISRLGRFLKNKSIIKCTESYSKENPLHTASIKLYWHTSLWNKTWFFFILGLQMVPNVNPPHLQLNVKVWGTFLCVCLSRYSRVLRLAKV